MFKIKLRHTLIVFAVLMSGPALAQDSGDVEVNLEVLQGYTPPPMFGDEAAPPSDNIGAPALTLTGPIIPPMPSIPPVPGRKPYFEKKAPPVKTVNTEPEKVVAKTDSLPPVPPRRPKKFNAPEAFVEEARSNLDKFMTEAPAPAPAPQPKAEVKPSPGPAPDDVTSEDLVEPTAQDVLASIDSSAPVKAAPEFTGEKISLAYQPGVSALPDDIRAAILAKVVAKDTNSVLDRLEIQAFATATDNNKSTARRISLARALEIRDFLVASKVDPSRIDIRPMGEETDEAEKDRVDILFIEGGE